MWNTQTEKLENITVVKKPKETTVLKQLYKLLKCNLIDITTKTIIIQTKIHHSTKKIELYELI